MAARMNKRKALTTYARIIVISQMALLILLFIALSLPIVGGGSITAIMNQSGLQRTRAEVIRSSVLILSRPGSHAQAISDLQDALPIWEQTQVALNNGDATLQLPKIVPEDIAQQLSFAQSDFVAMDVAARSILAHSATSPDPIQVQIVLDHERSYRITMSQVVTLWQQHIDSGLLHLVWIEEGLVVALIVLTLFKYFFITRGMFKVMEQTMP